MSSTIETKFYIDSDRRSCCLLYEFASSAVPKHFVMIDGKWTQLVTDVQDALPPAYVAHLKEQYERWLADQIVGAKDD